MKVIGFTGNYGGGQADNGPLAYLMADSAILYSGRPFFIPDFAPRFVATPAIVVRTGRLGKCIAPRFAHRYWDALTAGYSVQAVGCDDLAVLNRAFDGAAMVGDWVETSTLDDALTTPVTFRINDTVAAECCLADMACGINDLLARVSVRCSIKMGDLLFTGDCGEGHALQAGDRLTASIQGKQVLDVKVKL